MLLVFSCIVFTACGSGKKQDLSGSKYVGTWKAVSLTLKDEVGEFEEDHYLVLNADGTAEFQSEDEVSKCNWEETKDGFKLTGDSKMTFKDDGDSVKCSLFGVELHFEKQQ